MTFESRRGRIDMRELIDIGNKDIICIGDVHGEFQILRYRLDQWINKYNIKDTIFIVLGDCGFFGLNYDAKWFTHESKRINNILNESGNLLYMFRGNHDNPEIFNDEYILKEIRGKSYIHALSDYDVLQSEKYGSILIVPGAFSIDRGYREEGRSWWRDETPFKLSDNEILRFPRYDIVLSHSLPYYDEFHPNTMLTQFWTKDLKMFPAEGEDSFYTRIETEKQYLMKIQESVQAKQWVSGHYHTHGCDIKDDVKYIMIGIMEFYHLLPAQENKLGDDIL